MLASDILIFEHKLILRGLDILDVLIDQVKYQDKVDHKQFTLMIDFFRNYADKSHHGKEECVLFEHLEEKGLKKDITLIRVIEEEHVTGRNLIGAMENALTEVAEENGQAQDELVEKATAYARLLRRHIFREDYILFPEIDNIIPPQDQVKLLVECKSVERDEYESEGYYKYMGALRMLEMYAASRSKILSYQLNEKIRQFD